MAIRILFVLVLVLVISTSALGSTAKIKFEWDPNTEPDLKGYRLYQSSVAGSYQFIGADAAIPPSKTSPNHLASVAKPATSIEVDVTAADKTTVYFVLTAFDESGNESGPSNQVSYVMPDREPPKPPGALRALLVRILAWLRAQTGRG